MMWAGVPEWRLPRDVIDRAKDVLATIEATPVARPAPASPGEKKAKAAEQLSLFDLPEDPIVTALRGTDPDRLTPFDALCLLREWKKRLG